MNTGAVSVAELRDEARQRLPKAVFDYIDGGADDEHTVRANTSAYARIGLVPRVLRGGGTRSLTTRLPGAEIAFPLVLSPTAFQRLVHPDGEVATAQAAAKAGTVMVCSIAATTPIEDITATGADVWFQLDIQPDRAFTAHQVARAERAGCRALVVTVDTAVFGNRERDRRNGFTELPDGLRCENMVDADGVLRRVEFDADLTWSDLDRLRDRTGLPLVLKGITHPEDARLAVEHGAAAVLVSNHGGRQLDTVPATVDLLPAVVRAVDGRVPVLLDGGIRRGTDILKACALGATAVGIGRPVLWGLAAGGREGVELVLERLRAELERALALCGCAGPGQLTEDVIRW
ncbi:alpha-hydroxy acid oxidase [Actinosynnema sp. CS-041913]|uniref:alpha-hydroxy acid oxidase n=1 Tax=Actinosynnema sp. CS-041913 TaxID=3239917 RepID=UPI003D8B2835